jgi:hypothetical protein
MDEAERLVLKTCCDRGCYSCIKSYDNQYDHAMIDKSLFFATALKGRQTSCFVGMKKSQFGVSKIKPAASIRRQEVDQRSPAEVALEEYLRSNIGLARTTQCSINDLNGREVTRPDFALQCIDGEEVMLFVDGWAYHRVSIRSDMDKRNALARQRFRVMTLPARLMVPHLNAVTVGAILALLRRTEQRLIPPNGSIMTELPFRAADSKRVSQTKFGDLQIDRWHRIDRNTIHDYIASSPAASLLNTLESLPAEHFPCGQQKGFLLWPLYISILEKEENKILWEQVLILQTVMAGLGYRNLFLEVAI